MSAVRDRVGMAAVGALAAGLGSLMFLPIFLLMGGEARDYPAIVLADAVAVTCVAFVGGRYLARSRLADHSVVGRSAVLAIVVSLALWGVSFGLGTIGIFVDGHGSHDHLWRVVGLLVYAVVYLMLLVPLVVALTIQLWVAARLAGSLVSASLAGPPRHG